MSDVRFEREHYRVCSICRKPIPFGATYYVCSVSTCNRGATALSFCTVACWDAHVPTMRHRDAWAIECQAPTREAWKEAERQRVLVEQHKSTRPISRPGAEAAAERRLPEPAGSDADREEDPPLAPRGEIPEEILVVVTKLKGYIKARSGLRTSDGVTPALSTLIRDACDEAIRRAFRAGRQTVLDRDVPRRARFE